MFPSVSGACAYFEARHQTRVWAINCDNKFFDGHAELTQKVQRVLRNKNFPDPKQVPLVAKSSPSVLNSLQREGSCRKGIASFLWFNCFAKLQVLLHSKKIRFLCDNITGLFWAANVVSVPHFAKLVVWAS